MSDNPYESPQTVTAPPEPPVVVQTHLEQVAFRDLAEHAGGYAVVGQILLAACLVALILAGATWAFYVPDKNPNWVIAVMLGCGSVLVVLLGWAVFMGMTMSMKAGTYLKKWEEPTKRERVLIIIGMMGFLFGLFCVSVEFHRPPSGHYFLLVPFSFFLLALWPITRYQTKLLTFLRSFHTSAIWQPSSSDLRLYCFLGALLAASSLVLLVYFSATGAIAWGWFLPAVAGVMICVAPITGAYRQLAREFDKLWP